jgi:hypothetical protein
MNKGWKPMPVIIKVIWVILLVETIFAVLSIAAVYNTGFEFMGFAMYGMIAIDVFFVVKIALPIVIIIGMHQRYGWIWIVAVLFYLMFAVNGFASFALINELQTKVLEQMPSIPEGISEDLYYNILHWSLVISLITGALFNLAIMIIVFVKRKYFTLIEPLIPPSDPEPSDESGTDQ